MFTKMKTKGFNLEDTRLTLPDRLSTLLALIACAIALAVKTGAALGAISLHHAVRHRPARRDGLARARLAP
jgi:hypothetical protein